MSERIVSGYWERRWLTQIDGQTVEVVEKHGAVRRRSWEADAPEQPIDYGTFIEVPPNDASRCNCGESAHREGYGMKDAAFFLMVMGFVLAALGNDAYAWFLLAAMVLGMLA